MNEEFLQELARIISKIDFGTLQPVLKIHRGRVTEVEFRGWKRSKYGEDQEKPLLDILKRIEIAKKSLKKTKLMLIVEVKGGKVASILWNSVINKRFD